MSLALGAIVDRLVHRLVTDGHLVLVPGATVRGVADEVLMAMARRDRPAQVGGFMARVLVESDQVEELFLDDQSIARLLSEI